MNVNLLLINDEVLFISLLRKTSNQLFDFIMLKDFLASEYNLRINLWERNSKPKIHSDYLILFICFF